MEKDRPIKYNDMSFVKDSLVLEFKVDGMAITLGEKLQNLPCCF
jgi:hypothetical protein